MSNLTLSREQVKQLIAVGHVLVMFKRDKELVVLRMNHFLDSHPGFALPVLHFVGRDATDEILAYHPEYALKMMKTFQVATIRSEDYKIEAGWKPLLPPLHVLKDWPTDAATYKTVPKLLISLKEIEVAAASTSPLSLDPASLEPAAPTVNIQQQQDITKSFAKFREEVESSGILKIGQKHVFFKEFARSGALFLAFILSFSYASKWWHIIGSAVLLGLCWHQTMFLAHDAGHTEITGNQTKDKLIGGFIASWMMGMSLGWWDNQHRVHHLVPNHPEHDPDIQLLPFFAFSEKALKGVYSTYHRAFIPGSAVTLFLVQFQTAYFYFIMLFARFSLLGKSYHYLATVAPKGWMKNYEITGVVFFWTWFSAMIYTIDAGSFWSSWVLRVAFVLTSLATTCPIHVQIVLSHSAQSSEDIGPYESFAARQLRTTMDVACPEWMDFVHGGLHQQIAHHLFPRCPRPLLRKLTGKVQAWADATEGVTFESRGFVNSNFKMRNMLSDIAGQARVLRGVALQIKDGTLHMD